MTNGSLRLLGGWGRYPMVEALVRLSENLETITAGAILSRGLGRSYGDAALPPSGGYPVAVTTRADRLISFDPATGVLRAEAGLSLVRLNRLFLPRGWFPPASPGTEYVTLGGMVAADVHGKSHHEERSFGEHVRALKLRVADGRILEISHETECELFRATLGGMGLTGHILEVEFQMRRVASPWIWAETERFGNVDALVDAIADAGTEWPYTVAWADLLAAGRAHGRGILQRGRWANPGEAPLALPSPRTAVSVPLTFPDWVLSPILVRQHNAARYWLHGSKVSRGITRPEAFFYPLDAIRQWNLVYGNRGFTQYQAVLPARSARSYRKLLDALKRAGGTPFLCVLKDFQSEGRGMLSFPLPGLSIALDMPIDGNRTQRVVDAMNDVVAAEGGRVYLAKDALTRADHFRVMEPRLDAWTEARRKWDPMCELRSALSVRLFGDPP